jgi:hypothetical protein
MIGFESGSSLPVLSRLFQEFCCPLPLVLSCPFSGLGLGLRSRLGLGLGLMSGSELGFFLSVCCCCFLYFLWPLSSRSVSSFLPFSSLTLPLPLPLPLPFVSSVCACYHLVCLLPLALYQASMRISKDAGRPEYTFYDGKTSQDKTRQCKTQDKSTRQEHKTQDKDKTRQDTRQDT